MKFKLYLFIIVGVYCILGNSCSQNLTVQTTGLPSYKDSVYLVIEGDLNDPEVIWGKSDIYLKAFKRIVRHSRLKDNQIVFDFDSAYDINISSNIYDYVLKSFKLMNKKAKEKGWTIIKKNDIYIYDPQTKISNAISRSGTVVLKSGKHTANLRALGIIIGTNTGGNLGKIIDFTASDLKGNGMGDISIKGEIATDRYITPVKGYQSIVGYYCCNACAINSKGSTCEYNDIMDVRLTHEGPPVDYLSMLNFQGLPLITIRNYFYYQELLYKGII